VYLFVPAAWLMPTAPLLLVGQSVILALGALPVFGIVRHRLQDERSAVAFAILYLVNPSLHGINVRDFHAAALAIPLLLGAIYFAEVGRSWLFLGGRHRLQALHRPVVTDRDAGHPARRQRVRYAQNVYPTGPRHVEASGFVS